MEWTYTPTPQYAFMASTETTEQGSRLHDIVTYKECDFYDVIALMEAF
jgi:hypothetical protein